MTQAMDPENLRARLLEHFDRSRRPLPWRVERTPYRVLVSEFMLQQTRVDTVLPYYARWVERFPDFEALANATGEEVLLEWQGLGYYSRARNLHRTAKVVCERFGGVLPQDPARLIELPGIGEYTSGAVASIAFGRPVPAVDGNVRRVLSRLHDQASPSATELRMRATQLVDPVRPGDFNEALMELGATICTHRAPACARCPLSSGCRAYARGTVLDRPRPKPRRSVPKVQVHVAVVLDGRRRALLVRRPDRGLLAGMWEFPPMERLAALGPAWERATERGRGGATLAPVRHLFTHLEALYHPRIIEWPSTLAIPPLPEGVRWLDPSALARVPLPVAQQRIGALAEAWIRGQRAASRTGA